MRNQSNPLLEFSGAISEWRFQVVSVGYFAKPRETLLAHYKENLESAPSEMG